MHKRLVAGIRTPGVLARRLEQRVDVSVHLGTARFEAGAYTGHMNRTSIKVVIAMLWVVAVTIAGIVENVNSLVLWTVLVAVALLPLVVIMRWWSKPRQSMSESIQEALR